ncbi:MAG: serine hydrolase domain-containing protein [Dokdonella sp.]|uniref:serine hydrolase domain-containing protein n=1 Tax=Dokdonella sp. TaxID=2291710 RepID=UPI0032659F51
MKRKTPTPATGNATVAARKSVTANASKFLAARLTTLHPSLPREYTLADVKAHVDAAKSFKDIVTESPDRRILQPSPAVLAKWKRLYPGPFRYNFKAEQFQELVSQKLDGKMMGYCIEVRQAGSRVVTCEAGNAQTASDRLAGWNRSTRQHIASCSKFMTAVALVKLLVEKKISYDSTLWQYLPAYWPIHPDMKAENGSGLTFRHILTHTSGISTCAFSADNDFLLMKKVLNCCIPFKGNFLYCNLNFELMRVLIAVLSGGVDRNLLHDMPSPFSSGPFGLPTANEHFTEWLNRDSIWNFLTTETYRRYVLENVFKPAGVDYALFSSDLDAVPGYPGRQVNNKAFAYRYHGDSAAGWDSGNLENGAGAVGWRLSVKEMLDILRAVRRSGKILDAERAAEMCVQNFGIFKIVTAKGDGYVHNGWWQDGNKRVEQAVQFLLPDDMEIVGLGNSSVDFDVAGDKVGHGFQGEILDAYNLSFAK